MGIKLGWSLVQKIKNYGRAFVTPPTEWWSVSPSTWTWMGSGPALTWRWPCASFQAQVCRDWRLSWPPWAHSPLECLADMKKFNYPVGEILWRGLRLSLPRCQTWERSHLGFLDQTSHNLVNSINLIKGPTGPFWCIYPQEESPCWAMPESWEMTGIHWWLLDLLGNQSSLMYTKR